MPNRMGDIFCVCRDASDNKTVHYATVSSRAARQNFPWQKNLKLMQTAHLRNFLMKTPVFKDIVFWRLNERFMPNRMGDFFVFAVTLRTTIEFITLPTCRLMPLDKTFPGRKI